MFVLFIAVCFFTPIITYNKIQIVGGEKHFVFSGVCCFSYLHIHFTIKKHGYEELL